MKITIQNKVKSDIFIALFQSVKNSTQTLCLVFTEKFLHIQGLDLSKSCLFNLNIDKSWFTTYDVEKSLNICINTDIFLKVLTLGSNQKDNIIELYVKPNEPDCLHIDFVNSIENIVHNNINKYFKLPLNEIENYDELDVPDIEYDADIILTSKKLCDLINQLSNFSNDQHDLKIIANSTSIKFITEGAVGGEFVAEIDPENIIEYAIVDDTEINISYSLKYLNKLCLTNKISNDIKVSISNNYPMKIHYDLGNDSSLIYYISPKIEE